MRFRHLPLLATIILTNYLTPGLSLHGTETWLFGSAKGRDGDAGMRLSHSSVTNGRWSMQEQALRFENRFVQEPDDNNFTDALAVLNLADFGYEPGTDFTLWLLADISGVWEWNRFGLVAFADTARGSTPDSGFISARMQVVRRGAAEIALARDFAGRAGELVSQGLPERFTHDSYRLILAGEHQADGSLRLTFSVQRGDDDTPYVLGDTLTRIPQGTYFGFGGRFRSYDRREPVIDLIEMRYEPRHSTVRASLPDPIQTTGIWHYDGKVYRYRATLRRDAHHAGPLATTVVFSPGSDGASTSADIESLLDANRLVVEFNAVGISEDPSLLGEKMTAFREALPALLQARSEGVLKTQAEVIELPLPTVSPLRRGVADESSNRVRLQGKTGAPTPAVLAYNLGHFFQGSNAHDWWAYSGATGARTFISPAHIENPDHRPPGDVSVLNRDDFLVMRNRLSQNPTDDHLVNWRYLRERMADDPLASNNKIHVGYTLGHLSEVSPDVLIQASMVPEIFPIAGEEDWQGKWRLWRSYFSMVYYYASEYGIQRFAMHNEPNHPLMLIDPDEWLMRAALCADAADRAIEAVNRRKDTELRALLFVPVTAGDIGDPFTGPYKLYGQPILERWDLDFLGERTGRPLYANYAIQRYNASPENFGRNLLLLKNKVAEDLPWNMPMPSFSITEFNVHHGRFFDTIDESMDTPDKFIHFAGIITHLMRAGLEEFYVFKFGLTKAMSGRQFLVHKNGMFYCDNDRAPHNYGGPTRAAEIYRMFIQAFAPGRDQIAITKPRDVTLDISASHDPSSHGLWVFSINPETHAQTLDLDLGRWAAGREGSVLVSECSAAKAGEIVLRETLPSTGRLQLKQPAQSVWLLRFPPARTDNHWLTVQAVASAQVQDKRDVGGAQKTEGWLHVANPADSDQPRSLALYAFDLPAFDPSSLQAAVLTLAGQPDGMGDQPTQAQVFLVSSADWQAANLNWSNAPALMNAVPRGHFIRNRVVDNSSGAARVVGQINLSEPGMQTMEMDLTGALRDSGGQSITLLIAQEPRWDAHPSDRVARGDIQPYGMKLSPAGAESAPRIDLLLGSEKPVTATDSKTYQLFILAGQSNAGGRATWSDATAGPAVPDQDVLYFYDTDTTGAFSGLRDSDGLFVPLGPASNNRFGPEIGLSHRLRELGITNQIIIKYARGGTNLYSDWDPKATGGKQLYPALLDTIAVAKDRLDAAGINYTLSGLFWMQGESDSRAASSYAANLNGLVASLRRDLKAPELPVIIGRVAPNNTDGREGVRRAQVETAEADPLAGWVNTDDLDRFDGIHFDAASTLTLGRRMAEEWNQIRQRPSAPP